MDQDGLKRWKEFSALKWRDQVGRKVYGWWMLRTGTDRSSSESIVSICTRLGLWWNLYVGLWACFCVKNLRDLFFVAKGDVTIIMSDDDMVNLMLGKLNPQQVWLKWSAKDTLYIWIVCWICYRVTFLCEQHEALETCPFTVKKAISVYMFSNVMLLLSIGILSRKVKNSGKHGTGHETERVPEQDQVQVVRGKECYKL